MAVVTRTIEVVCNGLCGRREKAKLKVMPLSGIDENTSFIRAPRGWYVGTRLTDKPMTEDGKEIPDTVYASYFVCPSCAELGRSQQVPKEKQN